MFLSPLQGEEHNTTQDSIRTEASTSASGIKLEHPGALAPVSRWVAKERGKNLYEWDCPYLGCLETRKTKNAAIAHINQHHLCKPLICQVCGFSCYNPDIEDKHAKLHLSK